MWDKQKSVQRALIYWKESALGRVCDLFNGTLLQANANRGMYFLPTFICIVHTSQIIASI